MTLSTGISFLVNSAFFQLLCAYKITFCKPRHNKLWFPLLCTFNYLHSVIWNEEFVINVFNRIFLALCDIAPNEGNFKISVLTATAVRITDQILSSNVVFQVKQQC